MVLAALGLDYLLSSGHPLSVVDLDRTGSKALVAGTPGMAPNGMPATVTLLVSPHRTSASSSSSASSTPSSSTPSPSTPASTPSSTAGPAAPADPTLRITSVTLDAASLPPTCPPDAWLIAADPDTRITPRLPSRVRAAIALSDAAPAGCQGAVVPALRASVRARDLHGKSVTLRSRIDTTLTVATLGSPSIAISVKGDRIVVIPHADPVAPAGTRYTIEAAGADARWTTVCRLETPQPCATGRRVGGTTVRYRVTAQLGGFWRRSSPIVTG